MLNLISSKLTCNSLSQNIARSAVFDVMQRNPSDNSDAGNVAGGEDGSGVALETGFDHEQGRRMSQILPTKLSPSLPTIGRVWWVNITSCLSTTVATKTAK